VSLAEFLEKSRTTLVSRWTDTAASVYPFAAVGLLRTQKNPFVNPAGRRADHLAELLFSAVLGQKHDEPALAAALEEFIRVQAVQDMPAERSLAVLFVYTDIFRAFLSERNKDPEMEDYAELLRMETRQNTLALSAFGMYARVRETLFAAQLEDTRRRHSQILRLARRRGFDGQAG
jgi:hypothetical protein